MEQGRIKQVWSYDCICFFVEISTFAMMKIVYLN